MALASTDPKTFSDYDPLAWFYDRYWGPANARELLPVLEDLVLEDLPEDARILDLCCGTGHLCAKLVDQGYQVLGIDGSRAMLAYARNNAPGAEFDLADARWFELDEPVAFVTSTYESLNHVLSDEDLAAAFERVAESLEPGGVFLFDLNMEKAYGPDWRGNDGVIEDDHVIFTQNSVNQEDQTARSELTLFRYANGAWRRSDLVLLHRWFDEERVLDLLGQAGFEEAAIYDAVDDLGFRGEPGRTFFLVRKADA
ncbi:MAG: class I SAM-dependent methyltransferase [Candidatus Thermoplasmatota archaeon]|nr:class I SAM-dependent methyltransferase [Candidatus Thermoplasmatota archaeon]